MTKFAFNDPVIIRKSYPVADHRGREGRIRGLEEGGDTSVYNVYLPTLSDSIIAREDDLSLLAGAHPYNYPLPTHMEIIRKSDVVRSDGTEINVNDNTPQFDAPFIVITSDDFAFPELVGKTGRIVGRYLQTDSWHVVIDGERYVLARDNIVFVIPESTAAQQTPHLRVIQQGVSEGNAPKSIIFVDGNLVIDGEAYVPASKVIKVANKYGRIHDWCEVIETKVFPELGIQPPPPRTITFTVTVPEDAFLEDVAGDQQDYVHWDADRQAAELGATIHVLESRRELDRVSIEITSAGDDDPET